MSGKKLTSTKFGKFLSYVVVILLLAAVCGSLAYFTNGFTSDFKTFYVESNGKTYLSNTSNYVLSQEEDNVFDVKYTFGAINKEISGYSVKIVPNVTNENDFDFIVDGATYSFGAEKDLTKCFEIVKNKDCFSVKGDFTMQSILNKLYPTQTVTFDVNDVNWEVDNFTLLVYSYNNEAVISIGFHNYASVKGVELQEELIFEEKFDGTVNARK